MEQRIVYGLVAALLLSMHPLGVFAAVSPQAFTGTNFTLYSQPAPANDMALRDLDGVPVSLSRLAGKVTLLNFWRIDCPACNHEKPMLERVQRRYGSRGLVVLAVNLFDDYSRVNQYRQEGRFSFPIAFDPEKRIRVETVPTGRGGQSAYVVNGKSEAIYEVAGVPATYVMDRRGRIVGHGVGALNWEAPPFSELLEDLVAEHPPALVQNQSGPMRRAATPVTVASSPKPTPKEGPRAAPGVVSSPARPQADKAQDEPKPQYGVPQAPEIFEEEPVRLPFQGADAANSPKAAPAQARPKKLVPSEAAPRDPAAETVRKPITKKKPDVKRSTGELPGDPIPKRMLREQGDSAGRTPTGPVSPRAEGRPPSPSPAPLPVAVPVPPGPTAVRSHTESGRTELSPLPQAIPYSSSSVTGGAEDLRPSARSKAAPSRSVLPDNDGYVTARVPSPPRAAPMVENRLERGAPAPSPSSRPQGDSKGNKLEGFLMESVEGEEGMTGQGKGEATAPHGSGDGGRGRSSSWFAPLRRLTDGIQESVSQVLPKR